jgi:UDP-N-acetyl-D-galactosamine dehydrogenase
MNTNQLKDASICVVGLGYVGLPLLSHFIQEGFKNAYGYDTNQDRITDLRCGIDHTGMVGEHLPIADNHGPDGRIPYRSNLPVGMDYYFICVPTPDRDGKPDYRYVRAATEAIADVMRNDSVIVLESTVGPGTTDGLLRDIIKNSRQMLAEPLLAYSPERIDPNPNEYQRMTMTTKLVGTRIDNEQILTNLKLLYAAVFHNVQVVNDPTVAELAKCFENAQRDMNIAMMNELSMQCTANSVDFKSVELALLTKSGVQRFTSGIVGGHCIPVDPYYLAEWYEGSATLPVFSRLTHDRYVEFVAAMVDATVADQPSTILILGRTYKPNVKDTRNAGEQKLRKELEEHGHTVISYDPLLNDPVPALSKDVRVVVGLVNHTDTLLARADIRKSLIPLAIDCNTFIAVDTFADHQLQSFPHIHNI